MLSNRRNARMIASLAVAIVATAVLAPTSEAGPISDMLARHRQAKIMKLPPMDKPFSSKPVKDLNVTNTSLRDRLKKRFSLGRTPPSSGVIPLNKDLGVVRTAR